MNYVIIAIEIMVCAFICVGIVKYIEHRDERSKEK